MNQLGSKLFFILVFNINSRETMYHFNYILSFFKLLYYLKIKSSNLYKHLAKSYKNVFFVQL